MTKLPHSAVALLVVKEAGAEWYGTERAAVTVFCNETPRPGGKLGHSGRGCVEAQANGTHICRGKAEMLKHFSVCKLELP